MNPLSRYEMETHILWNAEEGSAIIESSDPVTIRKILNLMEKAPELYSIEKRIKVNETQERIQFRCEDKKRIKLTVPKILSDEQREALANARFKASRPL